MQTKGVFVIAGGSRGFARVLGAHAHRAGYSVALIARTRRDLSTAKAEITNSSNSKRLISVHFADLTKENQTKRAFGEIKRIHRSINVLVNNAATWTGGKTISQLTQADLKQSIDLNFFTAFNATQAVLALRQSAKSELAIVNIGATESLQGWDGVFAFCVGKSALRIFSQSLARELQPSGVHVAHLIIDGLINNARTLKMNPNLKESRFMNMDSIATSVLHIVSQEKSCWTFEMDLRPYNEKW